MIEAVVAMLIAGCGFVLGYGLCAFVAADRLRRQERRARAKRNRLHASAAEAWRQVGHLEDVLEALAAVTEPEPWERASKAHRIACWGLGRDVKT